jgi:hypothetical protein
MNSVHLCQKKKKHAGKSAGSREAWVRSSGVGIVVPALCNVQDFILVGDSRWQVSRMYVTVIKYWRYCWRLLWRLWIFLSLTFLFIYSVQVLRWEYS